MLALAAVGVYLAIGSCIALFSRSNRDKDEWLADDLLINSLTFLTVMIFWPRIFVVFARIVCQKSAQKK